METKTLLAQIMISPNQSSYIHSDDFFKTQLRQQLVNYIIEEGLAEFDFSDPEFKRVRMSVVVPKKAVK
jgi:hypothetical protein